MTPDSGLIYCRKRNPNQAIWDWAPTEHARLHDVPPELVRLAKVVRVAIHPHAARRLLDYVYGWGFRDFETLNLQTPILFEDSEGRPVDVPSHSLCLQSA
jgi:hypothetical protein